LDNVPDPKLRTSPERLAKIGAFVAVDPTPGGPRSFIDRDPRDETLRKEIWLRATIAGTPAHQESAVTGKTTRRHPGTGQAGTR
jgi:hypothetical protein